MKNMLIIVAMMTAGSAQAGDVNVKAPDNYTSVVQQTQQSFERCLGATVAHTPTDQCQVVATILGQLAALPVTPIPAPKSDDKSDAPK
jgi:hypothetical protein